MTEQEIEQLVERLSAVFRNLAPAPGCFTIEEAAEFVRCSTAYIRRQVAAGSLPAANIGNAGKKCLRITRPDLLSWLEQRKSGAIAVAPRRSKGPKQAPVPFQSRHWQQSPESPPEAQAV
jgi:excisionase family DNA binding protein